MPPSITLAGCVPVPGTQQGDDPGPPTLQWRAHLGQRCLLPLLATQERAQPCWLLLERLRDQDSSGSGVSPGSQVFGSLGQASPSPGSP